MVIDASDVQNKEDVYDAYMEHFRYQNVNEVTAAKDLLYAQSETDDAGRHYGQTYEHF